MEETQQKISFNFKLKGTQVSYYFFCKRKLWLFSHNIEMEHSSDLVLLGKLLHESSYTRKFKEIEFDGIKIDFSEGKGEIHEIKKSRSVEISHIWQLLYYIYYLKKLGINAKGVIDYPLLKRKEEVELTEEKEKELEIVLKNIREILSKEIPNAEKKKYCKKCSYYDLCFS